MTVDRYIAQIAAAQHGIITNRQLRELGLDPRTIRRRVRRGSLRPVHRGVYAVGHEVLPPLGREMAAVLACGEGAFLSHHSAAAIWGFRPATATVDIDVTITGAHCGAKQSVRLHRTTHPEVNPRLGRFEVDFLWREAGLVVEVDGYAFHRSRGAFERDRQRDGELGHAGYQVMRVTWRALKQEPEALLVQVASALAIRRARSGRPAE